MYLPIENVTCPKNKLAHTFQCLNNLYFQKQYETRYISTLVNSMDPDQLASLANSADPDQLSWMKWHQVGQVGHGISSALVSENKTFGGGGGGGYCHILYLLVTLHWELYATRCGYSWFTFKSWPRHSRAAYHTPSRKLSRVTGCYSSRL